MENWQKKRKPPPEFYTCKACGVGKHWIFECDIYKKKKMEEKQKKESVDTSNKGEKSKKRQRENSSSKEEQPKISSVQAERSVFISGLPFDMSNQKIRSLFEPCGTIVSLTVPRFKDSKRSKGIAFVTFTEKSMASKCLGMDGTTLDESKRYLNVTLQKETDKGKQDFVKPLNPCYRCGSKKHFPSQCKNKQICYRCRSTEHLSFACPQKKSKKTIPESTSS
mmetsp:Transcript_22759/g.29041  ORF Transcript_22759/g.29041 Transcript_22759/m.29041 type:complete len:222 (+) Transcript_22759:114-779(+)